MRASRTLLLLYSVWLICCSTCARASMPFPIRQSLGLDLASVNDTDIDDDNNTRNGTMKCEDARLRCAYRTGCGRALQHYITRCASVLQGNVNDCPEICQHALIALMSTDEGKELTTCTCAKGDTICDLSKQRAEVCRASVTATMNRTRVSCRVATWICNADALCSTALQYYNDYCKRMFIGKKCTKRCRNSINILRRQEKAARLSTCFCDGAEEYDCNAIHRNMDVLCFNKPPQHHNYQEHSKDGDFPDRTAGDPRTNKVPNRASTTSASTSWRILLFSLVLLLHSVADYD